MAEDYQVQVSVKNSTGDMLNVRAGSVSEVTNHLLELRAAGAEDVLIGSFFGDATAAANVIKGNFPGTTETVEGATFVKPAAPVPAGDDALGLCPDSGHPLVRKNRKDGTGTFVACSGFPACKHIVRGAK